MAAAKHGSLRTPPGSCHRWPEFRVARVATDVEGLANLLISLLAVVDNAEPFIDQLVATITSLEAPKASALKVYGQRTGAPTRLPVQRADIRRISCHHAPIWRSPTG